MANLKMPAVDTSGATQPSSVMAVLSQANIVPPTVIVYTGGILSMPNSSQISSDPALGYATSG